MTEQQYTCPFCHNDYTRYTIADHYGCGVEPLETIEELQAELDAITEEVAIQEAAETTNNIADSQDTVELPPNEPIEQNEEVKPEPKKRGRKPKTK